MLCTIQNEKYITAGKKFSLLQFRPPKSYTHNGENRTTGRLWTGWAYVVYRFLLYQKRKEVVPPEARYAARCRDQIYAAATEAFEHSALFRKFGSPVYIGIQTSLITICIKTAL